MHQVHSLRAASYSDYTPLRILVDENLNKKHLGSLTDYGIPLIALNEVLDKGTSDQEVFNYAAENSLSIITMDSDFLSFQNFDFRQSHGVIYLPLPRGNPVRQQRIDEALTHFAEKLAPFMAIEKSMLVQYDINGTYQTHRPYPDAPHRPQKFFEGSYAEQRLES